MDPGEWVTMREAANILGATGVGRETTRRLVYAGLAGEVIRRGNGTMVRRDSVMSLARRPWVPEPGVREHADGRRPTFVARLRTWPVLDEEERETAIQGPWRISALGRLRLRTDVERHGFVPLVATLGGFVVLGAEIVSVTPRGNAGCLVSTRPAGSWMAGWDGHRVRSPGHHHWWVWPAGLWDARLASTP